jgi:hypothetical protein
MKSYYVELRYFVSGADRDALDRHNDAMMDVLLIEPNLTDPDVGVNFDVRAVDVCASVETEDEPAAYAWRWSRSSPQRTTLRRRHPHGTRR